MATASLQSASSYLNNLLLARGLLQDGKPIHFVHPTANGNSSSSSDTDITTSRIINLVHDLVLRRDRDVSQRELLAANIRTLRAEESQRLIDFQRIQDKNGELARDLATAEQQQRALRMSLKKTEGQGRELREQMGKMKSMLDHVRAKCLGDVRKREGELEKLKGLLVGMHQRGKREGGGMRVNVMNFQAGNNMAGRRSGREGGGGGGGEWSLEKETNDFLAAIVNETSAENVALRSIVSGTMETLRELTGLDLEAEAEKLEEDGIGIPGQYRKSRQPKLDESDDSIIPCDTLAQQVRTILEHCRTILKDPSFVPIEEVHIREEEIIKLRIGWEKMASRWKEAVTMMDNWRRRMLDRDEKIDFEELSNLDFGRSVAVLPNGQPVLGQDDELSAVLFDHSRVSERDLSEMEDEAIEEAEVEQDEQDDESDLDIPPEEPSPKRLAASPARRGIRLPQPSRPLREINANSKADEKSVSHSSASQGADSGIGSLDGIMDENDTFRLQPKSRIPHQQAPKAPPLSVAEKLAAVEAEAKAAEDVRRREGNHKRKAKPVGGKKGARRRSTLSPEELATLMGAR